MKHTIRMALLAATSLSFLPSLAAAADEQKQSGNVEELVVTGTRLFSPGYLAPTPVTALSVDQLQNASPANLVDAINQLPQLTGSTGYRGGSALLSTSPRGSFLNLRDLGPNRVLVLFDGARLPPTNFQGTVSVDIIPQLLVSRVDVVTAGASAAYGSDALSGVVNFVLDKKFDGIKGQIEGGISGQGDNKNYRVGVAGGFKITDKLHALVSFERFQNEGILFTARPLGSANGAYTTHTFVGANPGKGAPGTAINPYISITNAGGTTAPPSGFFNSGPFANDTFNPDGSIRPFNFGMLTGTTGVIAGGDGAPGPTNYLNYPLETTNFFGRLDLEVNDNINAHLQTVANTGDSTNLGGGNVIASAQIFAGNPFIPPALAAQLAPGSSFRFSIGTTQMTGLVPTYNHDLFYSANVGLDGTFGEHWKWNVDYIFGRAKGKTDQTGILINQQYLAALDAVPGPNGSPVCRVTLTNPGVVPGCVPWNIFGPTAMQNTPQAVKDNILGDPIYTAITTQHNVVANISGEPFELWAGPVSMAAGFEFISQHLFISSNSDPSHFVDYTGVRGATAATPPFFIDNQGLGTGTVTTKEGYGEVGIPLLKDLPLVQSLAANGALRVTDYSTSGTVTTWKGGATYQPIDDIRFRFTRSRDIRAPSLYQVYAGRTQSVTVVTDPHTGVNNFYTQLGGGNPSLKPEVGNTITFGAVLQPRFLPNFNLSIDYYKTKITGAIGTVSIVNILNDCEAAGGVGPACALITRPLPFSDRTAANFPLSILNSSLNTSFLQNKGLDLESLYTTRVGRGDLTVRAYGNFLFQYLSQVEPTQPIRDYAGYIEPPSGGVAGLPKFKGTLSANYDIDAFTGFIQERYIGGLKMGPVNVYNYKNIPAVVYTDMTLTYHLERWAGKIDVFLSISNLFDRKPPIVPEGTTGSSNTNPNLQYPTLVSLYDLNGRAFELGTRFKF